MIKETDIAWAAGFFDGEGCISLLWKKRSQNTNSWWTVRISVTNTNQPALNHFGDVLGEGFFYEHRPIVNRRVVHEWIANDALAERALLVLHPYLVTKRAQADIALEARRVGTRRRCGAGRWMPVQVWERMIELENELKALNGRSYNKVPASKENRAYGFLL